MFSIVSVAASLLLAHGAVANPIARGACNPALSSGAAISIGSGNLEIGYTGSVPSAAIISEGLTTNSAEFFAIPATIENGGFVLQVVNQDNHSPRLFPTWVNGTLELETLVTPEDGKQGFGFICSSCSDPSTVGIGGVIGASCNVVSGWTGQCLQIGSAVGDAVTVANCADLGSGSQYFDVYLA
ncbi:hypothetical protein C8F04DRAFT_1236810 [Mycena alexandri]|uniref:Uncharacterized protein n=1 Tax=Mycena alexandri TaxID=1745969 RepID=A0AAD6WWE6_9AGAR|nr:hypothetical protein C8F04DRAFT_1236810 [Mycena alexandri]